jgi:hypothetical protein
MMDAPELTPPTSYQ